MGLIGTLRNALLLTPDEVRRAKVMAGDAIRVHGFGAEDRLHDSMQRADTRRERRVIRRAMDEAGIWHARFDDPCYSPEAYRLETGI